MSSELSLNLEHVNLDRNDVVRHAATLRTSLASLDAGASGEFLRLPQRKDLVREIRAYVAKRPQAITDVVQLGIGGSSLGAQAICQALLPARHNELAGKGDLRVHFPDNIDPESFGALLDALDPTHTLVHVVSKSGGTLETAAQLYALLDAFKEVEPRFSIKRNLVVTTGAKGLLRDFADEEGCPVLTFPDGVGGRFSALTASGLLVPALCGVPVQKILAGAQRMEKRCRVDALVGPAGRLAALHYEHDQAHGRAIHVDWIYSDALALYGAWFAQLWAESLGKQGRGPTPVAVRGTTDQHSQLQLYSEGPDDKVITVVRVTNFRDQVRIRKEARPIELSGRQLADVFAAEAQGTFDALAALGRPLVEITLDKITPESIGELLLLRQLQTALAGSLYRVNAFDQPGVEAGKIAALRILSRSAKSGSPGD